MTKITTTTTTATAIDTATATTCTTAAAAAATPAPVTAAAATAIAATTVPILQLVLLHLPPGQQSRVKPDKKQREAVRSMGTWDAESFRKVSCTVALVVHTPPCLPCEHLVIAGEHELLDMLLTQLSLRAKEANHFETLFPVLQLIHQRLLVSTPDSGSPRLAGAMKRNMEKIMSKMRCSKLISFVQTNPSVDSFFMRQLEDGLNGSRPVINTATSLWL